MSKEEGLTSSEIASKLGISEQTVYNQLSTALRLLKKEIKGTLLFFFTLFFY
jgi:DNA-binding CsgD family transcriptional regulator